MRVRQIENISTYVDKAKQYPRISLEDEVVLADMMRTGTPEQKAAAKERLVCSNLRLVIKIAHDFKNYGLGFADLVSEGNVGLMIAADKFDPGKGAKFSCYAAWWIKQSMRKALSWQSRVVRIPGNSARLAGLIAKARREYLEQYGEDIPMDELCRTVGCNAATVRMLDSAATCVMSLHETVSDDPEETTTFEALLTDMEDEEPARLEKSEQLNQALKCLTDLERFVISGLYGLSSVTKDASRIAQETGISVARIRDMSSTVLIKLRLLIEGNQTSA